MVPASSAFFVHQFFPQKVCFPVIKNLSESLKKGGLICDLMVTVVYLMRNLYGIIL